MAEKPRMTPAQLADKLLASEHADVVRASVAWMVAQLMEAKVTAQIGAKLGQRTPDRGGPAQWLPATSLGHPGRCAGAADPGLRTGTYFPSFPELRRRAEQALVAVVQEAYINGVSRRQVDRLRDEAR
jgi:putative transposase